MSDLMTVSQVANMLGVHELTVRRMVKDGRLPKPLVLTPRTHRWRREVIANALQEFEPETA